MNRLEELAHALIKHANGCCIPDDEETPPRRAAELILAASRTDVQELLRLASKVAISAARYTNFTGTKAEHDAAFEQLETALRMALAGREWQPIETAPKDRDVWVWGLATVWVGSCPFVCQCQAGWHEEEQKWITTMHDDKGNIVYIDAKGWTDLMLLPEILAT